MRGTGEVRLVKKDKLWHLIAPLNAKADQTTVDSMLTTLVRQGKLETDSVDAGESLGEQACINFNCMGCAASSNCPFIGKMPASYAKPKGVPPHGSRTQR